MEQYGLLLFEDFEKAFDSIEWSFIEKTLKHFTFGTPLVSWVNLFCTNISNCVLNNGWASDLFSLHRGVRHGCLLSSYLLILGAEKLDNAVRRDTEIRGIKLATQNMAKNSRHRYVVLFSRVPNPSINDSSSVISYWFTVAMEEKEFHIWAHSNTHTARTFIEISTIFQRLLHTKQNSEEKIFSVVNILTTKPLQTCFG